MSLVNSKRVIKFGFINFGRNVWLSIAAILILTLTLITISLSIIQNYDISKSIESINDRLDLTIYFDDKVTEVDIKDIQLKLQSRSDVSNVEYISKEQALKVWQERPTTQKVKELVTPENNPLPRSLKIKTSDPQSLEVIAKFLESPNYKSKIRRISFADNQKIIQDLIEKNNTMKRTGFVSSLTFIVISLIVIINTIRTIFITRKEEIEVMRLVGATEYFVRGPFIVEAMLIALMATILSSIFLIAGIVFKQPIIPIFLSRYFGEFSVDIEQAIIANLPLITLFQLTIAFSLTVITTTFSMRKYIKS